MSPKQKRRQPPLVRLAPTTAGTGYRLLLISQKRQEKSSSKETKKK